MGMSFREISALLKEAESRENLAVALKGGKAAKEFRYEREALEKAAGGAEKFGEADKFLADSKMIGIRIVDEARAKANDIENEVAAEIGRRTSALNTREQKADDHKADADVRDHSLMERAVAIKERGRLVEDREKDVHEAESSNANLKEALENTQARLTNWEQALDARDARIKAAVA